MSAPPERHQLPAVQRMWIRFAKRGRLRFTSHRDFQRAFERALRRAGVPMAYSHGFTPHPKVSFIGAASTGAASEAEYLEISLTARQDPDQVRAAIDEALPPGLDIVAVTEAPGQDGSLADRLQASSWEIALPGADADEVRAAVAAFLDTGSVEVTRLTKKGTRTLDARAAVAEAAVLDTAVPAIRCVVVHQTPTVRPDEVLAGLAAVTGFRPPVTPRVTRLAQGAWDAARGVLVPPEF